MLTRIQIQRLVHRHGREIFEHEHMQIEKSCYQHGVVTTSFTIGMIGTMASIVCMASPTATPPYATPFVTSVSIMSNATASRTTCSP